MAETHPQLGMCRKTIGQRAIKRQSLVIFADPAQRRRHKALPAGIIGINLENGAEHLDRLFKTVLPVQDAGKIGPRCREIGRKFNRTPQQRLAVLEPPQPRRKLCHQADSRDIKRILPQTRPQQRLCVGQPVLVDGERGLNQLRIAHAARDIMAGKIRGGLRHRSCAYRIAPASPSALSAMWRRSASLPALSNNASSVPVIQTWLPVS